MGLNTYPYSPFPASTEQLHKGDNEQIQAEIDQLKSNLYDATVYPYADAITIEDAVPANLAGCIVKIEPVQSGSGDPSPTNVRPISGHTEASVTVTDGDETTKNYTIALGDTIYGGTVDFDSGVMTVDRKLVDLGDYTWYPSGDNFYTSEITDFAYNMSDVGNIKRCPYYISDKYSNSSTIPNIDLFYNTGYSGYRCFINGDTSASGMTGAEFKEYVTGTHLCYELATPTTIQLTPQRIQLLKGQNTLTASTGDISVTVNGVSGSIGAVQEQVNELAEQLPTAPTTDGEYVLTVKVESGTPTYGWESAE